MSRCWEWTGGRVWSSLLMYFWRLFEGFCWSECPSKALECAWREAICLSLWRLWEGNMSKSNIIGLYYFILQCLFEFPYSRGLWIAQSWNGTFWFIQEKGTLFALLKDAARYILFELFYDFEILRCKIHVFKNRLPLFYRLFLWISTCGLTCAPILKRIIMSAHLKTVGSATHMSISYVHISEHVMIRCLVFFRLSV